jgi:hypothetical protein
VTERDGEPGRDLEAEAAEPLMLEAAAVHRVFETLRAQRPQRGLGHGLRDRDPCAEELARHLAGDRGDDELLAVEELDGQRTSRDERPAALGHQLEDAVEVGLAAERESDLHRGVQRGDGAAELLAPGLRSREAARVVDGDAGEVGQEGERPLVLLGELLAAGLVGEVEVAVRLVPGEQGNAEERVHLGMAEGEAVRAWMGADLVEPERDGVCDELAEHASTPRRSPDLLALAGLESQRDEPRQPRSLLIEHADRRVLRARELAGGDEHPLEDRLDVELAEDAARELEDSLDPSSARGGAGLIGR